MSATPPWPSGPPQDADAPRPASRPHPPGAGGPRPAWPEAVTAGGLMLLCLGLHIGAMFPLYSGGPSTATSVLSSPDETTIYICLEVGWAIAAALVLSRISVRGGVALAAGLASVELGLLITDIATGLAVSNDSAPGVWLALGGLGMGAAGVLVGASSVPMGVPAFNQTGSPAGPRVFVTAAAAAMAVTAYWPSWDEFHLVGTSGGTATRTVGNVFSLPAGPMAGGIEAGLAIGLLAIVAAFWAPPQVGAWLTAGVVIALASQLISGFVQLHEPLREVIGSGNTGGLNVARSSLSLTGYWALDVVAAVALALLALWAALDGRRAGAAAPGGAHGHQDGGVYGALYESATYEGLYREPPLTQGTGAQGTGAQGTGAQGTGAPAPWGDRLVDETWPGPHRWPG